MAGNLGMMHIGEIIDEAVDRLKGSFDPLKIILFGSHARGDATVDSDIDLLIVMPNGTNRRQAAIAMHRNLRDLEMPKDIVVTTPDEITHRSQMIGSVLAPALSEGKVLYERN